MLNTTMQYEVVEDSLHPGDYRVEAIDTSGDGEVYIAIFTGPDAESRAYEYADWKNSSRASVLQKAS